MSGELHNLLFENLHELISSISKTLQGLLAPAYQQINGADLYNRVSELVSAFLQSINKGLVPLTSYIQQITRLRGAEGTFLSEIQLALGLLEERAWKIVIDNTSRNGQIDQLWQISSTIGAARDQLAQSYLLHKERGNEAKG